MKKTQENSLPFIGLSDVPKPEISLEDITEKDKKEKEQKELREKYHDTVWLPFGITSFSELEEFENGVEFAQEIQKQSEFFKQMIDNILFDDEIVDKEAALNKLQTEFSEVVSNTMKNEDKSLRTVIKNVTTKVNGFFKKGSLNPGLNIYKDKDGNLRFLAVYSNNYIDNDIPREIISAKSHKRYVEKVDSGEFHMPVLQHYHIPGTEYGVAEMVAYDEDTGFAIAEGVIFPGHEKEAEAIMNADIEIALSHGMPPNTIKRDPDHNNVYIEHQTVEISDLPLSAAANKLTNFQVTKEEDMSLPDKKKNYLKDQAGWTEDQVTSLEKNLGLNKSNADAAGLDRKSKGDEPNLEPVVEPVPAPAAPVVEPVTAPIVEPVVEPAVEGEGEKKPKPEGEPEVEPVVPAESGEVIASAEGSFSENQVKELGNLLETVVTGLVAKMDESIKAAVEPLQAAVDKQNLSDNERIKKEIEQTPPISMTDIIMNNSGMLQELSATKDENNVIRKNSLLAKDHPAEPEENKYQQFSGSAPFSIEALINDDVLEEKEIPA